MFGRSGSFLKAMAYIVFIVGTLSSLISGLVLLDWIGALGILIIFGGALVSYLTGFILYSLGDIRDIVQNLSFYQDETQTMLRRMDRTDRHTSTREENHRPAFSIPEHKDSDWICKKCGSINKKNSPYCKDCGEYR